MNKYWIIFKNGFQTRLAYRFNTAIGFVAQSLSLLIMVYLWLSIYRQGGTIGSYGLTELISYYILTQFIILTIQYHDVGREIGDIIRQGELNTYLLKPASLLGWSLARNLGGLAYNLVLYLAILASVLFLWPGLTFPEPAALGLFLLCLGLGFAISFLISCIVGLLTFYLGFVMGLNYIVWSITSFLAGQTLPLDLLPPALTRLLDWLPFQFIAFVPISVANGRLTPAEFWPLFGLGLLWAAALFATAKLIYYKGLKKYEAYSG